MFLLSHCNAQPRCGVHKSAPDIDLSFESKVRRSTNFQIVFPPRPHTDRPDCTHQFSDRGPRPPRKPFMKFSPCSVLGLDRARRQRRTRRAAAGGGARGVARPSARALLEHCAAPPGERRRSDVLTGARLPELANHDN
ncbi:hypothetical protein EVAR_19526_1 [Eumeta japonica]|uniref:Uncharacterized protein n=1 Tax=Eumeta variegata TaxID=151549 RepID=A0A4C1UGG4_EUMVA|nr:hypothetical protein EVAR_19526_1 [Eumeta japonica]